LATGGAVFANTALNTASTNWIMTSEFRPNWNTSAIAGGLAFVGGGLHGFQHSRSLDYNPWTGRPYSNEKWMAMHADNSIAGGYADVTNFYNPQPARINYLGRPDDIFEGLYEWTDYLRKDNGSMYLRKTPYNKFYSISDVFDNLPQASNGGYGTAGDIKGKMLSTSDGKLFSFSIHRYSNNSIKGGSTMLKYLGADELLYKGGKYFDVRFYNGYRSANGSYNKVFTYSIYNENVYMRFFNAVFKFK